MVSLGGIVSSGVSAKFFSPEKKMCCLNPKIAYQRKSLPINYEFMTKRQKARWNKISFTYHKGWTQISLPCGECPACKLAKANEWATRIECEARTWDHMGIFVTLTYNNPHLPITNDGLMTLKKSDVQKFKKRLRKYIQKNQETCKPIWDECKKKWLHKIRTFECGEYGPKTGRPHYHQIIFNWIPKDLKYKETDKRGFPLYTSKTLQKIWGNGFVIIGTISWQSASYVARYTMKKQGIAKQKRRYYDALVTDEETGELYMTKKWHIKEGKIKPEFITMSNRDGIGAEYFIQNIQNIKKNNGILINIDNKVQLKQIPRYFKKLWEEINWKEFHKWRYQNICNCKQAKDILIKSYNLPQNMIEWAKETFVEKKKIELIMNKFNLLTRDNILYDGNEANSLRYGAV